MRLVVTYDITDNNMRNRFFKRLKRYLLPVQRSVFEGHGETQQVAAVEQLALRELDLGVDSVRLYLLCDACAARTRHLGISAPVEDPDAPMLL